MKWEQYECLACGHKFWPRKPDSELGKKRRQCPQCWSYDVYPESYITNLIEATKKRIETTPLGIIPLLDAVAVVIRERGLRLTPISTIRLIKRVWEEVR